MILDREIHFLCSLLILTYISPTNPRISNCQGITNYDPTTRYLLILFCFLYIFFIYFYIFYRDACCFPGIFCPSFEINNPIRRTSGERAKRFMYFTREPDGHNLSIFIDTLMCDHVFKSPFYCIDTLMYIIVAIQDWL